MDDLTGQHLGPYQILAPLTKGGMAGVYRGYQPSVEREVALKVLGREHDADPTFRARFQREAKLVAGLQHPHILPVFDFGQTESGLAYLVMPYIRSGSLAQALLSRPGPLPLARVRQIVAQVGSALDYAHTAGLIHRDIKPSNILLDERGNALVTDFGLARMVEGSGLTTTGTLMGTPAYMSPEQGSGQPLDPRSDIYSLGVVLYELATGRPPFQADTPVAVIHKHLAEPLPSPRDLNPALPEAVERVIVKALAKTPEARYRTAAELVQALEATLPLDLTVAIGSAPPAPAVSIAAPATIPMPPPRRAVPPWLWAGAAALMGCLGLGLGWAAGRALSPVPTAAPTLDQAGPVATQIAAGVADARATAQAAESALAEIEGRPTPVPSAPPAPRFAGAPPEGWVEPSGPVLYDIDFEIEETGMMQIHPGTAAWTVAPDDGGGNALMCERADQYVSADFGTLRGDADVAIQMRVRMLDYGDAPRDVGIAWMTARGDDLAWYGYAMNAQGGVLQSFYQGAENDYTWEVFAGGTVGQQVELGRWYVLRFELQGSDIRSFFDGRPVMNTRDERLSRGWFTLRCTPDTRAQFDDIVIWALP